MRYGMKKESTFEFWDRVFGSRGFESDVTYGSAHETWYTKGDFHVGYQAEDFRDKTYPRFEIVYHERGEGLHGREQDVRVSGRIRIAGFVMPCEYSTFPGIINPEVPEFLLVLDALAEPKKLPMCIGIKWASELVSIFLQQPAAGKI
jgi:hypothetical protein